MSLSEIIDRPHIKRYAIIATGIKCGYLDSFEK
jgi:hypothetical protein